MSKIYSSAELPEFMAGPCEKPEKEEKVFEDSTVFSDADVFMKSFKRFDRARAFELLSEYPLEEAIKRGKKMEIVEGRIPDWMIKMLGNPFEIEVSGKRKKKMTEKMTEFVMSKRIVEAKRRKFSIMGYVVEDVQQNDAKRMKMSKPLKARNNGNQ